MESFIYTPFSVEQRLLFAFVSGLCIGFAMAILSIRVVRLIKQRT